MSNASQDNRELERLRDAITQTWDERASEVSEFDLVVLPDQIERATTGWTVPVISRSPTGSAYRLVQILNELQESIEKKADLWITLYLDPFAEPTKNGAH